MQPKSCPSVPFLATAAIALTLGSPLSAEDWCMWGGSPLRNNIPTGTNPPIDWEVGRFDRKNDRWLSGSSEQIRWAARLGSQTYGTVVVSRGRLMVGTNNGAGYLKRYPARVDLGCVVCFSESNGEFLWQYSAEKLPTGRVHDWPYQGICSTPVVEEDRMWFVDNRGQIVCLDTNGFYDGEDDGCERGVWRLLFETETTVESVLRTKQLPEALRVQFEQIGVNLPRTSVMAEANGERFVLRTFQSRKWQPKYFARRRGDRFEIFSAAEQSPETAKPLFSVRNQLFPGLMQNKIDRHLGHLLLNRKVRVSSRTELSRVPAAQAWTFAVTDGPNVEAYRLELVGSLLRAYARLDSDKVEADVVWKLDMMNKLGVSQHNMATCAPAIWGDLLFVCTSNGVDESHKVIPAPDAPSFIAVHKHSGELLWQDNSPGRNILHGQWSAPVVGEFGGVAQVIFPGGDGWLYSFRADRWDKRAGKPILLWKFDANPKESKWVLGGRGKRNNVIAIPVAADGLLYIATGQDPEHGDGDADLWCIDPTKRGDLSSQLAVKIEGGKQRPVPPRRNQAVNPAFGELAVNNPNSAVVWHYRESDRNGDGKIDYEEQFHRTIGSAVIKNGLLFICDHSGLLHCLDSKTGTVHWVHDTLAACWVSPLVVEDKVYIADEDGEVAIFRLSSDIGASEPIATIPTDSAVYSTPVFANNVLYVANRSFLFAIRSTSK